MARVDTEKSAKIKVKTTIWNDGQKETFELTTFGRYYEKGESIFLQYEEFLEEGSVKSIVKVSEHEALILRSGAVNMRMVFVMNKRQAGKYVTPYGTIGIETRTKRLACKKEASSGAVDILYDLHMQGSIAGTYHMEIVFEEENQ